MPRIPNSPTPFVAMLFFIPWVLLLVVVILAVPVASWLDKRKMQAALRVTRDVRADADVDDEAGEGEEAAVEEAGDVLDDFGGGGDLDGEDEFGGGEFSAFEEVK